jgi:hypothetical protein
MERFDPPIGTNTAYAYNTGREDRGKGGSEFSAVTSRELKMESWENGPQFTVEGLSIRVLCAHGEDPVTAVSAKAGRFYYAEKVQGLPADVPDPGHDWLTRFLERAKRKKLQQEAFLGRQANGLPRLALVR